MGNPVCWWLLHRAGRLPVSIADAVNGARIRTIPMMVHVVLQLVSVGAGGQSAGRSLRENWALAGTWSHKLATLQRAEGK